MNSTPIDGVVNNQHHFSKKYAVILAAIIIFAGILGVSAYLLRSEVATTQTTQTQAALPNCLVDDAIPDGFEVDRRCYTPGQPPPRRLTDPGWISCPAPADGMCKKKNIACIECRDRFGLRIICRCQPPTPTTPVKPPLISKSCPPPQVVTSVSISCPNCP